MNKCSKCGLDNPGKTTYCSYCGAKLVSGSSMGFLAVLFGGSSIFAIGFVFFAIIIVIAVNSGGSGDPTSVPPSDPGISSGGNSGNSGSPSDSGGSAPKPTRTSRPPTVPPQNSYWCDDLSLVKLEVGDDAKIVWMKVNLRSSPEVPEDYYANIVDELLEGTSFTIIGGPECAHNGTWWKIRTSSGQVGWVREHTSDGYLIGK